MIAQSFFLKTIEFCADEDDILDYFDFVSSSLSTTRDLL